MIPARERERVREESEGGKRRSEGVREGVREGVSSEGVRERGKRRSEEVKEGGRQESEEVRELGRKM